ncbi:GTF3C5 [Blepharisma stoltei]|uniref:Transcription factor IIIC subunit 5 HTH domain-containing protein n=1 Tax=Blepharisma stoltei TaxID=1481888 RepID=A0AAU9JJ45_9CILI|nr:unnamed protein product [Blepharisma stoltei]
MENNLEDFDFELPEDIDNVLLNLAVQDEENYKEFLVPVSYTKNRLVQAQPFFYNPYMTSKPDDTEIDSENRPIKSISIPYEESNIPTMPLCKPPMKKGEFFMEKVSSFFRERPIWLKNAMIQSLSEENLSQNHLKHLLASLSYSYESGPWRNAYVRFGYNPREHPESVCFQVIDFRTREDIMTSSSKGPYDHTFSTLPKQQGQLYQLSDIQNDQIKDILVDQESLSPVCTKRTGWLTKKAYEDIRKILKEMYNMLKLE